LIIDNFENVFILSRAVASFCIAYAYYNNIYFINREIDANRTGQGLPTEVSLTPEDFRDNPELAEIFEVSDLDTNLDLNLETNEHLNVQEHLDGVGGANGFSPLDYMSDFDFFNLFY
jgi:hypothetical protein